MYVEVRGRFISGLLVLSLQHSNHIKSLVHRIFTVNKPGSLLNIEEQNEYETMSALYTQQNICQLSTTSAAYQYEDVPDPRAWVVGMVVEGDTHTLH